MAFDRLFLICATCREATVLASFQAMVGNVVKDRDPLDAFVQDHLSEHAAWPAQQDWAEAPPFVIASEGSRERFVARRENGEAWFYSPDVEAWPDDR